MTTIPQEIKEILFKTLKGDLSIATFEQWLYAEKTLEKQLNSEDYLDLISLNYKKSDAQYELYKLLKKQIDLGEYETFKMLSLLYEAKLKNERLPYILMEFYDLYCNGYNFLRDLGLGVGLAFISPIVRGFPSDTWEELTIEQQNEFLKSVSIELDECLAQVLNWLETKKIVLTGEQDEIGHYDYKDFRTDEERISKIWFTESENNATAISVCRNILFDKQTPKKWWEFWK